MRDLDLLKFQGVGVLLWSYQHTLVERPFQTPKPIMMMTVTMTTIGEPSEYHNVSRVLG